MSDSLPRVLYIEDNAMNWRLVQRLLSKAGYEMHWAEDGLKGCELANALKPALILLDINLPGLSGFETATKLRADPSLEGTLIVALTAKTLKRDKETALVTGCDGFIPKPIDPFLFVGQVEEYLRGRRDLLEKAKEGPALRRFSGEVVEHLEAQLLEAREGNRRLLEAQAQLEQRGQHLSRLLALSRDIILVRDAREIEHRVLARLQEELRLDQVRSYSLDGSGAYYRGQAWSLAGPQQLEVLPGSHALLAWARSLDHFEVIHGADLRQSPAWEPGLQLGFWGPRGEGLLRILRSRSGGGEVWGLVAAHREVGAYLPFEVELADLHAGLLRVSLENADLITHLDETSRALGNSYEGLESAYESLKSAQRALQVQTQQTALGSLFMTVAKRLQAPVNALKEGSAALTRFVDQPDPRTTEGVAECHRAMDGIRHSIAEVDDLVRSLLRRAGQVESMVPEWLHLHTLIQEELGLLQAERILPSTVAVEANYQATRDLLFGVQGDFTQMLGHLITHALAGEPTRLSLRTWGGQGHLRLELEDDGGLIPEELMSVAFEPFLNLREGSPADERVPGPGLPACAQLLQSYGGKVELLSAEHGSLLRISLPLV